MSSLYNTEHIEISNNDDIISIMIKTDTFDNTITEPIKNIFDNLFNHYDSKQNNQFGCIFNLDILSTYNIYCYAREFKNYFMQNAKKLDTHVYASVIVTSRTFIKCVIKPIIILTKSSNTCAFKKTHSDATTFLQNFRISHNILENNLDTWISPPSPSQSTRLSIHNTDIHLSSLSSSTKTDSIKTDSTTSDSTMNDSTTSDSTTNDSTTSDSATNDSITNDSITNDSATNDSATNDSDQDLD